MKTDNLFTYNGIKEEFKDKVFEIFRRLHAVDKFEGNGIGLASCKRICISSLIFKVFLKGKSNIFKFTYF